MDERVPIDALVFVLCVCLAFWSFKTRHHRTRQRLRLFVDTDLRTGHREPDPDDRAPSPGGDIQDIPAAVRTELAAVLRVAEPAELDLQASLFDLGIDSLLALDLRKRLQRATGRKIALATLLGGVTGSALIDELAGDGGQPSEGAQRVDSSRD